MRIENLESRHLSPNNNRLTYQHNRQMKTYHLPVVVEVDEDGIFIVSCPLYKGCPSYGKNIDEALANLKEVAEMCVPEQQ